MNLTKGVTVPYETAQSASDEARVEAALADWHVTDGPLKIAEVVADHFRATGRLSVSAMDHLKGIVDDDELSAVLREAGVPGAMMEWASRLAGSGDYDNASRLQARIERVFGPALAHQLDEIHGVSAAYTTQPATVQ